MVLRRQKARGAHEKDMDSYELFAWRDALSVADFLEENFGAAKARKVFESVPSEHIVEFEAANGELIGDFIQKPESQRKSFLSRISKQSDEVGQIIFLTLAILGLVRTKAVMELRDRYRTELAPGRGNRVTTASLYDFSRHMRKLYRYTWPAAVFHAIGVDDEVYEN